MRYMLLIYKDEKTWGETCYNIVEANGDSTNVTWAIHGPSPYMSKVMGIFLNMDRMIGKDFETGLAALKTVTEK
jgi:hypothetical protein